MILAIIASGFIALLSLLGIFFFGKNGHITGTHRFIVPVAIGIFLGVIFFDLIPETLKVAGSYGSIAITIGFLSFYLLAHFLRTYHHHHYKECVGCSNDNNKNGANMLLIGNAVHNIADGVVITSAFLINPAVGLATTFGITLHAIPLKISEFSVLLKAGFSIKKATTYNFISALTIMLGVLLSWLFISFGDYIWVLTGLAAGNLLYIVASDMIPEINNKEHGQDFVMTFISTISGLVAITTLLYFVNG